MTIMYQCVTGTTSADLKTGVEYGVLSNEGDMKQEYTTTSSGHTAVCVVNYEDSDLFLAEMLGYSKRIGNQLQRVLPEKSGWDALLATDTVHYAMDARLVKCLAFDEPDPFSGWPTFKLLHYAVTFVAPLYKIAEDGDVDYEHERNVTWSRKGEAQNEKIPGGGYKFPGTPPIPLSEVGVLTGRSLSLQAKWIDVPYVNFEKLSQLSNKVNNESITFDNSTYLPETVLFQTWAEEKRVNAFGTLVSDLVFNFNVRIDGRTWNAIWRRTPGGGVSHDIPTADGTLGGERIFIGADLNDCFSFV